MELQRKPTPKRKTRQEEVKTLSAQCSLESENEKLKKENKELWDRYYELQIALIEKETIELKHARLKLEFPWYMKLFMRICKLEWHSCIDNDRVLDIWFSSYWLRSWEQ